MSSSLRFSKNSFPLIVILIAVIAISFAVMTTPQIGVSKKVTINLTAVSEVQSILDVVDFGPKSSSLDLTSLGLTQVPGEFALAIACQPEWIDEKCVQFNAISAMRNENNLTVQCSASKFDNFAIEESCGLKVITGEGLLAKGDGNLGALQEGQVVSGAAIIDSSVFSNGVQLSGAVGVNAPNNLPNFRLNVASLSSANLTVNYVADIVGQNRPVNLTWFANVPVNASISLVNSTGQNILQGLGQIRQYVKNGTFIVPIHVANLPGIFNVSVLMCAQNNQCILNSTRFSLTCSPNAADVNYLGDVCSYTLLDSEVVWQARPLVISNGSDVELRGDLLNRVDLSYLNVISINDQWWYRFNLSWAANAAVNSSINWYQLPENSRLGGFNNAGRSNNGQAVLLINSSLLPNLFNVTLRVCTVDNRCSFRAYSFNAAENGAIENFNFQRAANAAQGGPACPEVNLPISKQVTRESNSSSLYLKYEFNQCVNFTVLVQNMTRNAAGQLEHTAVVQNYSIPNYLSSHFVYVARQVNQNQLLNITLIACRPIVRGRIAWPCWRASFTDAPIVANAAGGQVNAPPIDLSGNAPVGLNPVGVLPQGVLVNLSVVQLPRFGQHFAINVTWNSNVNTNATIRLLNRSNNVEINPSSIQRNYVSTDSRSMPIHERNVPGEFNLTIYACTVGNRCVLNYTEFSVDSNGVIGPIFAAQGAGPQNPPVVVNNSRRGHGNNYDLFCQANNSCPVQQTVQDEPREVKVNQSSVVKVTPPVAVTKPVKKITPVVKEPAREPVDVLEFNSEFLLIAGIITCLVILSGLIIFFTRKK